MNTRAKLHCEAMFTTMSVNGQIRAESTSICFWNQGTSEVKISNNIRLAPAILDPVTGFYRGGESYIFEDPTGRELTTTFDVVFSPTIPNQPGVTPFNNLIVQWLISTDNANDR